MISTKVQDAFNKQLGIELESAHLYLSMAAYFHSNDLDGMAHWMQAQAHEEFEHAMKFYGHINDRNGRVKLPALSEPKHEWASPLEAWQEAYGHEQFITGKINDLTTLIAAENDNAAVPLLQWFQNEQIEEEASTLKIARLLKRIGDSGNGLIMLDVQLGKRGS